MNNDSDITQLENNVAKLGCGRDICFASPQPAKLKAMLFRPLLTFRDAIKRVHETFSIYAADIIKTADGRYVPNGTGFPDWVPPQGMKKGVIGEVIGCMHHPVSGDVAALFRVRNDRKSVYALVNCRDLEYLEENVRFVEEPIVE